MLAAFEPLSVISANDPVRAVEEELIVKPLPLVNPLVVIDNPVSVSIELAAKFNPLALFDNWLRSSATAPAVVLF